MKLLLVSNGNKRRILLATAVLLISLGSFAQSGDLVGKIVDRTNRMVVPFVEVQLSKEGKNISKTTADIDGQYKLMKIPSGVYTLKAFCVGYDTLRISDVNINDGRKLNMNLEVTPKKNQITEVVPIPLYIPKNDTVKLSPADSIKPKARSKKDYRF